MNKLLPVILAGFLAASSSPQQATAQPRFEEYPASTNLSRMFTLAIDMGIVQTNPCQKVQSLSEDNERNRHLSMRKKHDCLDVLQGRRKHLRSIVLIDLQTGLRKQELLSLRWQNVDFRARCNSRYELAPRTN